MDMQGFIKLIAIIGLLVFGWASCTGELSSEATSQVHEQRLLNLRKRWNTNSDQEQTLRELSSACQHALQEKVRSSTLDVLLADTLSNILLRPDLGLPLYEPHLTGLGPTLSLIHI